MSDNSNFMCFLCTYCVYVCTHVGGMYAHACAYKGQGRAFSVFWHSLLEIKSLTERGAHCPMPTVSKSQPSSCFYTANTTITQSWGCWYTGHTLPFTQCGDTTSPYACDILIHQVCMLWHTPTTSPHVCDIVIHQVLMLVTYSYIKSTCLWHTPTASHIPQPNNFLFTLLLYLWTLAEHIN